jgi:nitroreductase
MIEILRVRRSIRKYLDKEIETEKVEILKETLLRSPSSRNINPWEFSLIRDKKLLVKLSKAKLHGASFLKDAALGIVIAADGTKSDVWIEDCSIAAILVQFAAQSLGLGSCWIQIRERMYNQNKPSEQYIKEILQLAVNLKVESIISIGYPAEKKEPISKESLDYKKVKIIE